MPTAPAMMNIHLLKASGILGEKFWARGISEDWPVASSESLTLGQVVASRNMNTVPREPSG